ncbi:hypothetical protein SAMN02745831_00387 [Streptomyces sp. PgraA7]|nr:hypothetical protein SAMN02745831_00387 [Streptomyces sp. PgraA7]
MTTPDPRTCPRAGCNLPRWTKRDTRGNKRLTRWCSAWCRHWDIAARNALLNSDVRQAATLLEAAEILDRRTSGGDPVHGVQVVDGTRWIVHKDTAAAEIRHRRKAA